MSVVVISTTMLEAIVNAYWKTVGGLEFLPGTARASDRFARMSWNLYAAPKVKGNPLLATAEVFSLVRALSVPLGLADPKQPNIASTIWRAVLARPPTNSRWPSRSSSSDSEGGGGQSLQKSQGLPCPPRLKGNTKFRAEGVVQPRDSAVALLRRPADVAKSGPGKLASGCQIR
ncbi:MAG: hypothetical protein ACR652_09300 [Methylocystis sp.]|uniref:hypothetical protein n=1 Tax=Methylocystis sp. TaxID=1911079 RepID=UPI003DA4CB85